MPQFFKTKKRVVIASAIGAALVVGTALATPSALSLIRQNQYAAMVEELNELSASRTDTQNDAQAALLLSDLQVAAANTFAADLAALTDAAEPILSSNQKTKIKDIADTVTGATKSWQPTKSVQAQLEELKTRFETVTTAEGAAKLGNPLIIQVATIRGLDLYDNTSVYKVRAKEEPTDADFAKLESDLEAARNQVDAQKLIAERHTQAGVNVQNTIASTLPDLKEVAAAVNAQAEQVIASATRAQEANTATQATVEAVTKANKGKQKGVATALKLATEVKAYVTAATASTAAHDEVLAQEAAAEAAAAGRTGYRNPSTGAWVPLSTSSSGSASPGSSTSGESYTPVRQCTMYLGQQVCQSVPGQWSPSDFPGQPLGWNPDGSVTGCPEGYHPGGYGNGKQYCVANATDW